MGFITCLQLRYLKLLFNNDISVKVLGEKDCSSTFKELTSAGVHFEHGVMAVRDFVITDQIYLGNNYAKVIVDIKDCGGGCFGVAPNLNP